MVKQESGTRAAGECVPNVFTTFWRPLWSTTEQTQGNMESIFFIQLSRKKPDIHTCLVPLDCSRICAIFRHSLSPKRYISSLLLLFSLSYLFTVSSKSFQRLSCSKQNNGERFGKKASLVVDAMATSCCEDFLYFRHSQVVKSFFCLRFSIFLLCK